MVRCHVTQERKAKAEELVAKAEREEREMRDRTQKANEEFEIAARQEREAKEKKNKASVDNLPECVDSSRCACTPYPMDPASDLDR